MAKRKPRFDHDEIAARVEQARVRQGMQVKDLCAAARLAPFAWYKKTRRSGSTFTLDELSAIAEALDAPPGWPFVEREVGEAMTKAGR